MNNDLPFTFLDGFPRWPMFHLPFIWESEKEFEIERVIVTTWEDVTGNVPYNPWQIAVISGRIYIPKLNGDKR